MYLQATRLLASWSSSFDSQASINFGRKKRRGRHGGVPPKHVKGEIKRGRPSSVAQERARLQEAQTENEKRRGGG